MAQLELGFEIVSNYFTTIDTDDYIEPEEWEDMTKEEKSKWIKDHEFDFQMEAERESGDSLGNLQQWEDLDTGEEEEFFT